MTLEKKIIPENGGAAASIFWEPAPTKMLLTEVVAERGLLLTNRAPA